MSRSENVTWRPHPHCHQPHSLWSAPDDDATEYEVTAFVAALVRLTKPRVVVETGTYLGHTSNAIAEALSENGVGRLVTFEIDTARALAAGHALRYHVKADRVVLYGAAISEDWCPPLVDVAFLDSGMRTRQADLDVIWPRLAPGGLVLIHDASPLRPPGQVQPPGDRWVKLDFATPRGLNVFQKPW